MLLYSGLRLRGGETPADQCTHVVRYNWDGIPERHYRLTSPVSSICWEGDKLYGLSNYQKSTIYVFSLTTPITKGSGTNPI